MVAGLAAARHAAVTSVVTEASFLDGPASVGTTMRSRRSEPGMRTELMSLPPTPERVVRRPGARVRPGCLAKAAHAMILDYWSQVFKSRRRYRLPSCGESRTCVESF